MATQKLLIESIWGGETSSQYFTAKGQYLKTIGIDPFFPISDSVGDRRAAGVLRPVSYAVFSSTNVTANPYWILTNPKDTNIYTVLNNGRLISYSSSFGSETLIGTATSSSGNGATYYNNYLYVATNTDVSRYGPLTSSPSLSNTVWTGSTLGTQTAMQNTTYPSIRGSGTLPNHVMHVHVDGQLYMCDFDSGTSTDTTRGKGLIHAIQTKYGTAEGDTNNGSAYNVLDLPPGYMPTCLESYGNSLVIGAIQGSNGTIGQGKAALFFWDTYSPSFYAQVELSDFLVTALRNVNGQLYVFSGNVTTGSDVSNGYRVSAYLGGETVKTVYYSSTGSSPLAGAVEEHGDRALWGTFDQKQTATAASPTYYGVVKSYGSHNPDLPGGIHTVINAPITGTAGDGIVMAIKNVQQGSLASPSLVLGHRDSTTTALSNRTTTYGTAVFQSQIFNVNRPFVIRKIRYSLGAAVAANMTITPTIYLDDFSSSSTSGLTVVNSTNYASSNRHVLYKPNISGNHNFCLELAWSGTALLPVLLPIEIEIEVLREDL